MPRVKTTLKSKKSTTTPSDKSIVPKAQKSPAKTPTQRKITPEQKKLLDTLSKKFGENAVTLGVPEQRKTIKRIRTGSLTLDIDLGGGIPCGRFIEIAGPLSSSKTTSTLHILRNAQKMGMTCAFIDAEGTTDPEYLEKLGIDPSMLYYSRPDSLEEATQMLLDLQRSGVVQLGVIDSIAALGANKENDSEMDETTQLGVTQKLWGEYFRKYQMNNNRLERDGYEAFTLIGLNQLREKIGVSYGDSEYCLHYDTKIPFTDGRCFPIGEVVNNKIKGKVWSLNEKTNKFEEKEIIGWKDNGVIDDDKEYIHIQSRGLLSKNGVYGITATYDHKILTDTGWKTADSITMNDRLVTRVPDVINGTLKDFLFGSICGDSTLVSISNARSGACLRIQDNVNPEYAAWKVSMINACKGIHLNPIQDGKLYLSNPLVQLSEIKDNFVNRDVLKVMRNHYTPLTFAVWYMDDGSLNADRDSITFSVKRFSQNLEYLNELCIELERHGISGAKVGTQGRIRIPRDSSIQMFKKICRFIPPCMQYKLPKRYRNKYVPFKLTNEVGSKKVYTEITEIRYASKRQLRRKHRYDICVGDNHNFLAGGSIGGVIVHNTPGGRAKGFTASVEIRLRIGDWIKEGKGQDQKIVGQVVKYKIPKNKTYARMRNGEFDFYFDDNEAGVPGSFVDNQKEVVVLGYKYGVIERNGGWFKYKDQKYQGIDSIVSALKDQPELLEDIREKIYKVAIINEALL